jgi:hypothetical protein
MEQWFPRHGGMHNGTGFTRERHHNRGSPSVARQVIALQSPKGERYSPRLREGRLRQESLRALSKRYGVNQKTVAKWRKRNCVGDLQTGPKEPWFTALTVEEEAIIGS